MRLPFYFWGLGLWDKALMLWPLSGLAVASILVYRREVIARLRPANLGIAVACLAIGASPLIWYNVERPGETAAGNISFSGSDMHQKLKALRESVDGSSMFGFMVYGDGVSLKRQQGDAPGLLSVAIKNHSELTGETGCLSPLCWRFSASSPNGDRGAKALLFLGTAMTVGMAEMVWNKGTGVFVHHVILLWPFPFAFIGIAFSRRRNAFRAARHCL